MLVDVSVVLHHGKLQRATILEHPPLIASQILRLTIREISVEDLLAPFQQRIELTKMPTKKKAVEMPTLLYFRQSRIGHQGRALATTTITANESLRHTLTKLNKIKLTSDLRRPGHLPKLQKKQPPLTSL
jgi:hypothetical protein